ncbi:VirB4 family type IV secretion/conjugal transfer ATPase [Tepidimonas charontis]|uniref:Type IV secretion system protein virB4 n=1 Tax=Tepidimonas charontis TaxID=2267262 RepID=A0A554XH26_9BURK|nr:transporter [Tepidimonas charontis]TSE35136.1 Type IV secretion system protein virB4 [Tepidimonas charontis]
MQLQEFRSKALGLPDFLPWAGLIDNGIVLTKSGAFLSAFAFRGPDLDSSTREELVAVAARLNAALLLPDGWSAHVDLMRERSRFVMPPGEFPDRTTRLLADARAIAREGEDAGFETRAVMTFCWHPDPDAASKVEAIFVEGGETQGSHTRALARFKNALREVRDRLSGLMKIERLIDRELPDGSIDSPLLAHLAECVDFQRRERYILPEIPMYLDARLGRIGVTPGFEPIVGQKTVIALTISDMPATSHPGILDFLGRLPVEYRWSNRFIFLSARQADKEIKRFRSKWAQKRLSLMNLLRSSQGGNVTHINLDADAMARDAVEAEAENSSGLVRFGYWTSVILLAHEDAKVVRETARQVQKRIVDAGFECMIEDVNAMEAYIGSMPGNVAANVRRPLINTMNLAHYLPVTQVWTGPVKHPCPFYPAGSPPLLLTATDGATPYRLCLHAGDLGHTAIVGPTGSGKSTLLATLVAAHFRYPRAQAFVFDKGYSMMPLVLAAGGQHYDIAGEDAAVTFCPLAEIDTDAERAWAAEWLESLCGLQGLEVTPEIRKELFRAVKQLAEQTTMPFERTMTAFVTVVQDEKVRAALEFYTLLGPAGHLFDAAEDTLSSSHFQVFEIEHLMSRGERFVVPALTMLFHRLSKRFDGSPTLLVLDEAWIMLGHPVFREKIREWLKVLRKSNVAVIFATQSLSDLSNSGIADVVFESCPSKILLANSEAQTEALMPLYQAIGLNSRQIEIIARMTPKRQYFHLHPDGRRVFELGLTAEELAFVGRSDKESLRRIRALATEDPEAWPATWLRECGLADAAEAWLSYE